MQTLNLVVLLAFLCIAGAVTDLKKALWMTSCSKLAITKGVPEANIPSHQPVHITRSIHINRKVGQLSFKFDAENLTFAGLPTFTINATQLSADTDSTAIFNFSIYWPKFVLSLDYDGQISVLFYKREAKGKFSIVIHENTWTGKTIIRKPGKGQPKAVFEVLDILWTAGNVEASLDGLGSISKHVADDIALATKLALDTHFGKAQLQDFLKLRLNTIWASDYKRVGKLISWCKKQGL